MANDKRDDAVNHAARMIIRTATQGNRTKIYQQLYDEAYDAGHAAATAEGIPQSDGWVTIETRLPDREPNKSYSNPPCLVTLKGEVRILCFNHEHLVWDDETGDDFYCQIGDVIAWQPLPRPYHRPSREGE